MIRLIIYITILFVSILKSYASANANDDPNLIVNEMALEIEQVNKTYFDLITIKEKELLEISSNLVLASTTEAKLNYLLQKDRLKEELQKLKLDNASDISRIRYLKGLQIIRILYEKVLSLDHHFASVRTFSEINKIANPNQYPEFTKVKELVQSKRDKKQSFDLTSVLGTNTIVSVVNTFSNMLVSGLTKEEKETELKNIECIIDFTLRMQGDLNTIYFETAYLQKSNEFPIDRLMQFVTQYNSFIDQGGKFYEKFKIILNSYENEQQCQTKLPMEYQKLKNDIDVAINKFNVAYKPVEVNGSKMKEILYGINEYE